MTNRPKTPARIAPASSWRQINGPLFRKYVAILLAVVCVVLLINALLEAGFAYQEHKASLIRIQREQAEAAAAKIGQFIKEIESQVGWTTQLPWSAGTTDQRKFDGLRLLARCRRSRNWRSSIRPAKSSYAYRGWRWTWSAARPIFPKSRNSPTR
jgi:hypothetical protein